MRKFLLLLFLTCSALGQNQSDRMNWNQWRPDVSPNKFYQNGGFIVRPSPTQMAFSWTIPSNGSGKCVGPQTHTSVAVFNAAGNMIRTIWTYKSWNPGNYGWIWNGLDDYGNAASGGPFTIKLACNNIVMNWDGLIGNTEQSTSGQYTMDAAITGNIASAPVFFSGKMYGVTGYTEQHFTTPVFDEVNPNGPVTQWLPILGNNIFNMMTSDGHRIYLLDTPYSTTQHGGVICFVLPSGTPCNLSGTPVTGSDMNTFVLQVQLALNSPSYTGNPYPGLNWLDVTKLNTGGSPTNTAITGLAVQLDGTGSGSCATNGCLATAHGYYDWLHGGGNSSETVASLDTVYLWDKTNGNSIGSFTVTNPQRMVFDKSGNLWIISGYYGGAVTSPNILYECTSIGGSNTCTQIGASTYLNPQAIAVSPTTGHLFIADGGAHQQIYEVSVGAPTTFISTLGVSNGYNNGSGCNANIDPAGHNSPTFFFDIDTTYMGTQFNSPFTSWIQVDENGNLWIGDWSAQRILEYTYTGGAWNYDQRIAITAEQVFATATDPTRIFAGIWGETEYTRNYSVPLLPGDPEAPGGNGSWDIARNWWPCIETVLGGQYGSQWFPHGGQWLATNGNVINFMFPRHSAVTYAFQHNVNGTFTAEASIYPPGASVDLAGNSYTLAQTGTTPNITYSINRFPLSGTDSGGFPIWGSSSIIGSYTANSSLPQAQNGATAGNAFNTFYPSTGNIIPIYQTAYSAPSGTNPVFHAAGLPIGESSLTWTSMKAVNQAWMNGDGTMPGVNLGGLGNLGTTVGTLGHEFFFFIAGNNGPWGSNWVVYRDDGMFEGQFGYQTGFSWKNSLNSYTNIGYCIAGLTFPPCGIAPGLTADVSSPYYVQNNGIDYMFIGDQAYRAGVHEVSISNLSSFAEISATGTLGTTVSLQ